MRSFCHNSMMFFLAAVYLCLPDFSGIRAARVEDSGASQEARNFSLVHHFGAGACYQVVIYDSIAYFGRGSVLEIYDIRDPYNPVHVASNPLGYNIYGLFFDGRYMYVAAGSRGLQIVDLYEKDSPVQLGKYEPANRRTVGVQAKGIYAYAIQEYEGLRILNVQNKNNPQEKAVYYSGGNLQEIIIKNDYAYLASGTNGLRIVGIVKPLEPAAAGYFDTPGITAMIYLEGNRIYVADSDKGLRIIDAAKPQIPAETGYYELNAVSRSVAASDRWVYLGTEDGIVRLLDATNPARPVEAGFYSTGGTPHRILVWNDYIFVADAKSGLHILRNSIPLTYAPGMYDFGSLSLGYDREWDGFRIYNNSDREIRLDSAMIDREDFLLKSPQFPVEISPQDSIGFTVRFRPGSDGVKNGILSIFSDFPDYPVFQVSLSGKGVGIPTGIAGDENIPESFSLAQNYPNPFNGETVIGYTLPRNTHAVLKIYSVTGHLVKVFENGYQAGGSYSLRWNGRDDRGLTVASGVYFYSLETSEARFMKKMILLK